MNDRTAPPAEPIDVRAESDHWMWVIGSLIAAGLLDNITVASSSRYAYVPFCLGAILFVSFASVSLVALWKSASLWVRVLLVLLACLGVVIAGNALFRIIVVLLWSR